MLTLQTCIINVAVLVDYQLTCLVNETNYQWKMSLK